MSSVRGDNLEIAAGGLSAGQYAAPTPVVINTSNAAVPKRTQRRRTRMVFGRATGMVESPPAERSKLRDTDFQSKIQEIPSLGSIWIRGTVISAANRCQITCHGRKFRHYRT